MAQTFRLLTLAATGALSEAAFRGGRGAAPVLPVSTAAAGVKLVASSFARTDIANGNPPVTPPMDTTLCAPSCTLALCFSASTAGLPAFPVSDSYNNTWVPAVRWKETDDVAVVGWYSTGAKTGPAHIFTATGYGPSIAAMAFTGVASFDAWNRSISFGPQSVTAITPTNPNELVVACFAGGDAYNVSVDAPLNTVAAFDFQGSGADPSYALGAGYIVASSTDPVMASFSFSAGGMTASAVMSFYSDLSPAALNVTTAALPEAFVGAAYSAQLTAAGGVMPYTWALTSGTLPAGVSLAADGALSGTPTAAALRVPLAFTATDARGTHALTIPGLELTVAAQPLAITTSGCPNATQYAAYAGCTLTATGGTEPYIFSWLSGAAGFASGLAALPEGLSLNAATGAITGPLVGGQGTYTPLLVVTDAEAAQATTSSINFRITGDNTLGGCKFFPDDSIFHTNIASLPVDTSVAAPMDSPYLHAVIHPFFGGYPGGTPNGIPFLRVPHDQANVSVSTTVYGQDFTTGPYPSYAPPEGSANSGYDGDGGDRHTLILQMAGPGGSPPCKLYEMWQGRYLDDTSNTTWTDSCNAMWPDLSSNALRTNGLGSSDACGLPVAPLLVNYDEACGPTAPCVPGEIRHPIRFTLNHVVDYFVWPGRATAGVGSCKDASGKTIPTFTQLGQGANGPASCSMSGPCGQIYRLRANESAPAGCVGECAAIVTAFRNYGIILADNGASGGLIGTPDARWNDDVLSRLKELTLGQFEPVDVSSLIINNDSGQAKQ